MEKCKKCKKINECEVDLSELKEGYFECKDFEPINNLKDMVNQPPHYTQGAIECIDVIEEITKPCSKFEAYIIGTVLKYLWRFKFKNGLEDLKKARWYLDRLIGKMEGEENGR